MPTPQRIAARYLARQAYDEKGRSPDVGWQHGLVEPFIGSSGEGSQVPPARDDQGAQAEVPEWGEMKIPGYEWHDQSEEFHDNPPGEAGIQRVASAQLDLQAVMGKFRSNLQKAAEQEHDRVTAAVRAFLRGTSLQPARVRIDQDGGWYNIVGEVLDTSPDLWMSRSEVEQVFVDLFDTSPQLSGSSPRWTFSMGGF